LTRPEHAGSAVATLSAPPVHEPARLSPLQAFGLSFTFIFLLGAVGFLDTVRQHPTLLLSITGCAAALLAWGVILFVAAQRRGRFFLLDVVVQKQHYVQA